MDGGIELISTSRLLWEEVPFNMRAQCWCLPVGIAILRLISWCRSQDLRSWLGVDASTVFLSLIFDLLRCLVWFSLPCCFGWFHIYCKPVWTRLAIPSSVPSFVTRLLSSKNNASAQQREQQWRRFVGVWTASQVQHQPVWCVHSVVFFFVPRSSVRCLLLY